MTDIGYPVTDYQVSGIGSVLNFDFFLVTYSLLLLKEIAYEM